MSRTTNFDNRPGPYDEAVSWCEKVIQSRDEMLFDPQAFHTGVSNAADSFNYTFEVSQLILC